MSNKLQIRSVRAFYEDSTKSKLTIKYAGVVPIGDNPTPILDINHGSKAMPTTFIGRQVIDGGTNTLFTFETSAQVHSVDEVRVSNTANVPTEFNDVHVANNVTVHGTNGSYNADRWDYVMRVDTDGGTAVGYTADEHGSYLDLGKAGQNVKKVRQFTIDNAGEIILEGTGEREFGLSCTVTIEGVQRASIPLTLAWSETNLNYTLTSTQLIYLYDTFVELIGASVGFSICEHN